MRRRPGGTSLLTAGLQEPSEFLLVPEAAGGAGAGDDAEPRPALPAAGEVPPVWQDFFACLARVAAPESAAQVACSGAWGPPPDSTALGPHSVFKSFLCPEALLLRHRLGLPEVKRLYQALQVGRRQPTPGLVRPAPWQQPRPRPPACWAEEAHPAALPSPGTTDCRSTASASTRQWWRPPPTRWTAAPCWSRPGAALRCSGTARCRWGARGAWHGGAGGLAAPGRAGPRSGSSCWLPPFAPLGERPLRFRAAPALQTVFASETVQLSKEQQAAALSAEAMGEALRESEAARAALLAEAEALRARMEVGATYGRGLASRLLVFLGARSPRRPA